MPKKMIPPTISDDDDIEISDQENSYTNALIKKFEQAMEARERNDIDSCCELLLQVIKQEPRLPEPHLEIANIYLIIEKLEDARVHIEEAITYLENGGQWMDMDLSTVLSLAYATKSEIYHALADQDEIVLNANETEFIRLMKISKEAKQKSEECNPNQHVDNYEPTNLMFDIEEDEFLEEDSSSSFDS